MTTKPDTRGGAPVGYMTELSPVEAGAVLYLRLWGDGPDAQAQAWNDFASVLGVTDGRAALSAFEQIHDLCARYCRRPLMRHQLRCKCLGADEACFANLVAAASEGQREDAMLIATLLVRPDTAPGLVDLAERFGLALRRMALSPGADSGDRPINSTLH